MTQFCILGPLSGPSVGLGNLQVGRPSVSASLARGFRFSVPGGGLHGDAEDPSARKRGRGRGPRAVSGRPWTSPVQGPGRLGTCRPVGGLWLTGFSPPSPNMGVGQSVAPLSQGQGCRRCTRPQQDHQAQPRSARIDHRCRQFAPRAQGTTSAARWPPTAGFWSKDRPSELLETRMQSSSSWLHGAGGATERSRSLLG
ncbi:unnamed protein product, partial [Polarella glacialis]